MQSRDTDDVLKDLKNNADIVARAPGNFCLCGEHSVMFGYPAMRQAVPLYVYVGVKRTNSGGITLKQIGGGDELWIVNNENLNKVDSEPFTPDIARKYFLQVLGERLSINAELEILCAVPTECGLSTSAAMGIASALGLFYAGASGVETHEIIKGVTDMLSNRQRNLREIAKNNYFDEIFRLGWQIDAIFHKYAASGANAFASFVGSPDGWPVVYQGDIRDGAYDSKSNNQDTKASSACDMDNKNIIHWELYADELHYEGFGLREKYPQLSGTQFPLRVALVYSGEPKRTVLAINGADEGRKLLQEAGMQSGLRPTGELRHLVDTVLGAYAKLMITNFAEASNPNAAIMVLTLVNAIQQTLAGAYRASSDAIDDMCLVARQCRISAKISGGGQGGDAVILSNDKERLNKVLLKLGTNKAYCVHIEPTRWGEHKLRTDPASIIQG